MKPQPSLTLTRKRDEITRPIVAYEKRINRAKASLAHISAAVIRDLRHCTGKRRLSWPSRRAGQTKVR